MPHKAAFHQSVHCLLIKNNLQRQQNIIFEGLTCNPLKYKINNPYLLYQDIYGLIYRNEKGKDSHHNALPPSRNGALTVCSMDC